MNPQAMPILTNMRNSCEHIDGLERTAKMLRKAMKRKGVTVQQRRGLALALEFVKAKAEEGAVLLMSGAEHLDSVVNPEAPDVH